MLEMNYSHRIGSRRPKRGVRTFGNSYVKVLTEPKTKIYFIYIYLAPRPS